MNSSVTVWDCNGTGIFKADIRKISDTKINGNSYNWSRFVPREETDRHTDRPKLIMICSNYSNAPEVTYAKSSYKKEA
jgi:hypothetical protein